MNGSCIRHDTGNTSHLLAYAEYDPFAPGYGALAVRVGSSIQRVCRQRPLGTDTTTWHIAQGIGSVESTGRKQDNRRRRRLDD